MWNSFRTSTRRDDTMLSWDVPQQNDSMRRLLSTDVSHINLPPLAHVELSSAALALPLSFTSALGVISSAIWSIASQIKNALLVTNLITSSQKYVASQKLRPTELMSNPELPQLCVFNTFPALRIMFSRSGLRLLALAEEAAVYLGEAESIPCKFSFSWHRVHLACCLLYCKPLKCSNDVGKNAVDPLLIKHHRDKVSNIVLVGLLSPLWSDNEAKGRCRASHNKRTFHIKIPKCIIKQSGHTMKTCCDLIAVPA